MTICSQNDSHQTLVCNKIRWGSDSPQETQTPGRSRQLQVQKGKVQAIEEPVGDLTHSSCDIQWNKCSNPVHLGILHFFRWEQSCLTDSFQRRNECRLGLLGAAMLSCLSNREDCVPKNGHSSESLCTKGHVDNFATFHGWWKEKRAPFVPPFVLLVLQSAVQVKPKNLKFTRQFSVVIYTLS